MDFNGFDIRAQTIARYLAQKLADANYQSIGFELEHFVVEKKTRAFVPYYTDAQTGRPGVEAILESVAPYYDKRLYERRDDACSPNLIALSRPKTTITLEPGAQLEISVGPAASITEIEEMYRTSRHELDSVLDGMGYELVEYGYHPTACAHEIPLIPKARYHYMNDYFKQTGTRGICMMRATAATQVSIDFVDETDAVRKLRIASALGPLFAFVTDNAPVYEGVVVALANDAQASDAPAASEAHFPYGEAHFATETVSPRSGLLIPGRMARMVNWDDCDPHRCLVAPNTFDEDFGFLSYAQNLLRAPAIFTQTDNPEGGTVYHGFTPFEQILSPDKLDEKMIEHILSLFFYDTRFKRYVEIRQADSLPPDYCLAFVALVKGIFYNEEALDFYAKRFEHLDTAAIAFAKTALRKDGYRALVYQQDAAAWLDEMIAYAYAGLPDTERLYLLPLAKLIEQRTTLLDIYLRDLRRDNCCDNRRDLRHDWRGNRHENRHD